MQSLKYSRYVNAPCKLNLNNVYDKNNILSDHRFVVKLNFVTTLTLGSRLKQRLAKVRAKNEAQESHFMLSGMPVSVRE